MKEARYFYVPQAGSSEELPPEEAAHATRVLRLQNGDEMFLMDGCGSFYRAKVTLATQKRCLYTIEGTLPQEKTWNGRICIAMAPTKMMERTEWFAEKATEIGIDELDFVLCRFSERKTLKEERIEKIVVSATKQSRKPWKPVVNAMEPFGDFVAKKRNGQKYIAHCYKEIQSVDLFSTMEEKQRNGDNDEEVTILVGPEGDFSIDEVKLAIKHGYTPVSLGKSRLRTETAALYAAMAAQTILRKS